MNFKSAEKLKVAKKTFKKEEEILKDAALQNAWEGLECEPPWTIERFLNQMSLYRDDYLELSDVGKK